MLNTTFVLRTLISGVSGNLQGTFPLLRGGADHREQITGSSTGTHRATAAATPMDGCINRRPCAQGGCASGPPVCEKGWAGSMHKWGWLQEGVEECIAVY